MSPITTLTDAQIEALGDELDELRGRIIMDLGERDAAHIRRVIAARHRLEIGGRVLLFAGVLPPLWLVGTTALALSKILDEMEISHNVMHGQYEWIKDPVLTSAALERGSARPGERRRHSHNDVRHTHTNVLGRDRDIGDAVLRDYVLFPALAGPGAPSVLAGNLAANLTRNLWSFMVIRCGHFPEATEQFAEDRAAGETRGGWYARQMLGSANLTGGRLLHLLGGSLSHQIEHHLFPDLPAHRYAEIATEVRDICERYGLPYNTAPLARQFGSVVRKIGRLALLAGARTPTPTAA